MLTFLINKWNSEDSDLTDKLLEARLTKIGISADLPVWQKEELAKSLTVCLYDSTLPIDAIDFQTAVQRAIDETCRYGAATMLVHIGHTCDIGQDEQRFAANLQSAYSAASTRNIEILLSNRREPNYGPPIIIEKIVRLCKSTGVYLALDVGAAHFHGSLLEAFYDVKTVLRTILLNDYGGTRLNRLPADDSYSETRVAIADHLQIGYGTAATVRIAELSNAWFPQIPMYINGMRHENASFAQVLLETQVLMAGRVHVSPAGGLIGRNSHTGRILI